MKRRLQVLALCATALLAVRMMAQDTGGGATGGGDASGASGGGATNTTGGATTTGGDTSGQQPSMPTGGATDQNGNPTNQGGATGTTPGGGGLFEPEPSTGSTVAPGPVAPTPPANAAPIPGTTPVPTPPPASPGTGGGAQGGTQAAPVTFNLPGSYGGGAPQSFTLGQGRLAKPPVTFSFTVTQGYDDNIFSATAHPVAAPTPIPAPTPLLQERIIGFRITPPSPPTAIFQTFRPKVTASPTPATGTLGVVGSPVSTATLGIQIQKGSPRTVLTFDASLGLQDYWNQPGQQIDDTASFDASFVHRLSERASISLEAFAVYQKTPNFALINAPTNNGSGGNYLNGDAKVDFSFSWTRRLSTVTSYDLNANLLQSTSANDVYEISYGNQFRYTVSPRFTATSEIRESNGYYPSAPTLNTSSTFYLVGLDSLLTARLRNTTSGGLEVHTLSSTSTSQTLPYVESSTTLALPRGSSLTWTNRYGSEESQTVTQTTTSYRTTLGLTQPLSTKLVGSVSLAYNYLQTTDSANAANSFNQKQLQLALSLGYNLTPRFSLSLSYTYLDLLTNEVNSSYQRQQIYLGGSYTFR